jgi:hypothetical protein
MNSCKLLLVCLFAAANSNASASDAQNQQAVGSFSMDSEGGSALNSPAPTLPKPSRHGRNPVLQGNFSNIKANIKGGVVIQMRATSAFVREEAAKPGALDDWLILVAAFGLVVLQLRRKHKSLPQRRITPYG